MLTAGVMGMPDLKIPKADMNLTEKLGQGGSGIVFKALWRTRQQIVAVKQVLRFDPELSVLQSLRHKHIISFLGAIHEDQFMGIVMEFAEKGSLHQYLTTNEINFEQMLLWARHMALGLNYLHNEAPQKMIHRDLKSRNVVICADLRAKICDFGCSKPIDNSTRVSVQGTYAWMAPEIMKNIRVSEKCDTYSFAVVLWELITGESPFKAFDSHQIIFAVCQYQERMPIPDTCPEKFAKLIRDCWEQEAAKRPDFKVILTRLNEMLCNEELSTEASLFLEEKKSWKEELECQIERIKNLKSEYQKKEMELQQKLQEKDNKIKQLSIYRDRKQKPDEKGVKSWTEVEVIQWLNYMIEDPLHDYSNVFLNNHITGPRLIELTEDDLVNMNITSVGHRKEILSLIKNLVAHFVVMENFPPLQSPPKSDRDRKNSVSVGTKFGLTLILGNHCIVSDTAESKWCLYAMLEGDEIVVNSVNRVEFTLSNETVKIKKPPFVMNNWVSGEPSEIVKCAVFFKSQVIKPKISQHTIDVKLQQGGTSEQHVIDIFLDLECASVASLSSSHASSFTSLSMDLWVGLNTSSPGQGAWANGPPIAMVQKSPLCFTPLKSIIPPTSDVRRGSSPLTSPNYSPQVGRKSSSPWPGLNHSVSSPAKINQIPNNYKSRPKMQMSLQDHVTDSHPTPVNDPYNPRFITTRPKSQDTSINKPILSDSLSSSMMNLGFSSGGGSIPELPQDQDENDCDTFILDEPKTFDMIRKTVADQVPARPRGMSVCSTISNNSTDSVIEMSTPKKTKSNLKTLHFSENSSSGSDDTSPDSGVACADSGVACLDSRVACPLHVNNVTNPTPSPSYASSTTSTQSNENKPLPVPIPTTSSNENIKPSYAEILGVQKALTAPPQESKTADPVTDKCTKRERKSSGSSAGSGHKAKGGKKTDYYRGGRGRGRGGRRGGRR